MDAELCLLEMAQPELSLDAKSINARLTKLEDQIKSGSLFMAAGQIPVPPPVSAPAVLPEDAKETPAEQYDAVPDDPMPMGFWAEVAAGVRQELKPPISGFFAAAENAPLQGVMRNGVLELRCKNSFTADMIGKPEILEVVARKATVQLGRPVKVVTVDMSSKPSNARLDDLLRFGRSHSDIINMKE